MLVLLLFYKTCDYIKNSSHDTSGKELYEAAGDSI